MRYSTEAPNRPQFVSGGRAKTHDKLFRTVAAKTSAADRKGGILLAGGTGPIDIAVRDAQRGLRYDRLPSWWSRAAIILDWSDNASADEIIGIEVPLVPTDRSVPERNGATLFALSQYEDREAFPNLGFGCLKHASTKDEGGGLVTESLKATICDAALNPCRDRTRFRLWDWMGLWLAHTIAGAENPLLQGVAHPGAGLCEYAYGAAGFDLTPGATEPCASPEVIWSTLLYWTGRLSGNRKRVAAFHSVMKEESPSRKPLGISLEGDFQARGTHPPRPRGKK
ncbi:MAG: hypothetical protein KDB53_14645 [Planctomycetes bacterium]|nr:hypothetical protein [Planctomycetota bacterium]